VKDADHQAQLQFGAGSAGGEGFGLLDAALSRVGGLDAELTVTYSKRWIDIDKLTAEALGATEGDPVIVRLLEEVDEGPPMQRETIGIMGGRVKRKKWRVWIAERAIDMDAVTAVVLRRLRRI
jgi:hypothetical protein